VVDLCVACVCSGGDGIVMEVGDCKGKSSGLGGPTVDIAITGVT